MVGQIPASSRAARTVAEVYRAMQADPRLQAWRADRQASFRAVMRVLLARSDWESLRSRPTHAVIAAQARLSERTVTSRVADAVALGYLAVLEEGTTKRIRTGRLYPLADPHEGNRAADYQICVPLALAEAVTPTPVDAGQTRTCDPSPLPVRARGESGSSHVVSTCTTTRARESYQHQQTGQAEKSRSPRLVHRRPSGRGLWRACLTEVRAVWQALPTELTRLLAEHEAPRVADAIAVELAHRTVDELADRIARHWEYWRFKLAAGLVRSPAAIAFRLVRRDFDCHDVRCEDRWQLDADRPCAACQERAQQVLTARYAGQMPPATAGECATRHDPRTGHDEPVCGAPSAPRVALPAPTIDPAAAERGAALARRLLVARSPAERDKIIESHEGARLYTVKAESS